MPRLGEGPYPARQWDLRRCQAVKGIRLRRMACPLLASPLRLGAFTM